MMPTSVRRPLRVAVAAAVCVLMLGAASACGDDDATTSDTSSTTTASAGETTVLDGTYTSTAVAGHSLAPGTEITMEFSGDHLSVNAGCNTMAGSYSAEGGVLAFDGDPAMTMMGCDDALQFQDQWITEALTEGMTIDQNDDTILVLSRGTLIIDLLPGATAEGHDLSGQPDGPSS